MELTDFHYFIDYLMELSDFHDLRYSLLKLYCFIIFKNYRLEFGDFHDFYNAQEEF